MIFKINKEKLIQKMCDQVGVPRQSVTINITINKHQELAWQGLTYHEERLIDIIINGNHKSKTKKLGYTICANNHYEILTVALAHELTHLKTESNDEHEPLEAEVYALNQHRKGKNRWTAYFWKN